jgi:hypothetical protein
MSRLLLSSAAMTRTLKLCSARVSALTNARIATIIGALGSAYADIKGVSTGLKPIDVEFREE